MKDKIKVYDKIILFVMPILIIMTSLWVSIISITRTKSFYMWQYDVHNTSEITGYSTEELSLITDKIIGFLFGETESMQIQIDGIDVFSNQALIHMRDVRDLYDGGRLVGFIAFLLMIACIIYIYFRLDIVKKIIFKYSCICLIVLGVIVLGFVIYALVDFYDAFTFFHHIIFPDERKFQDAFFGYESNYPEKEGVVNQMLILILSLELFQTVAIILFSSVIFFLVIWFVIIRIINKKSKMGVIENE